jgi:hypothetical protein
MIEKSIVILSHRKAIAKMNRLLLNHKILLFISAVLILMAIMFTQVRNTESDLQGTLLVSEAIAQHGTIKLDTYETVIPRYTYKIHYKNGHYYYYFPLGTSLFATPLVYAANILGFNMVEHEKYFQLIIAGLIGVGSFLFLFLIAHLFLRPQVSVLAAAIFWFGTSFASTGGTALWSHNLATLFALIAVYLALGARDITQNGKAFLIGFCLFSAYFCRPTLSLLSPVLLLYLWLQDRRLALKTAAIAVLFLGLFVGFSWHEFHQLLPDYYMPKRLESGHFWTALYGNLFSPARGLLVYSPFLILALCALPWIWKKQPENHRALLLLVWPVIHLITISRFPHWWAGHSFGPRLMYDVLPALFIVFLLYLSQLSLSKHKIQKFILLVTVIFAIGVNTGQAMYNWNTALWNTNPNIDYFPEYLFDWTYPQFLHTRERHAQRLVKHEIYQKMHGERKTTLK